MPESIKSIGQWVFQWCDQLEHVTLPAYITELEAGLFSHCERLEYLIIPEKVTAIRTSAFLGADVWVIKIPKSVDYISEDAFENCDPFYIVVDENSYAESYCRKKGLSFEYEDNYGFLP